MIIAPKCLISFLPPSSHYVRREPMVMKVTEVTLSLEVMIRSPCETDSHPLLMRSVNHFFFAHLLQRSRVFRPGSLVSQEAGDSSERKNTKSLAVRVAAVRALLLRIQIHSATHFRSSNVSTHRRHSHHRYEKCRTLNRLFRAKPFTPDMERKCGIEFVILDCFRRLQFRRHMGVK